jgi:hypothetical protein
MRKRYGIEMMSPPRVRVSGYDRRSDHNDQTGSAREHARSPLNQSEGL